MCHCVSIFCCFTRTFLPLSCVSFIALLAYKEHLDIVNSEMYRRLKRTCQLSVPIEASCKCPILWQFYSRVKCKRVSLTICVLVKVYLTQCEAVTMTGNLSNEIHANYAPTWWILFSLFSHTQCHSMYLLCILGILLTNLSVNTSSHIAWFLCLFDRFNCSGALASFSSRYLCINEYLDSVYLSLHFDVFLSLSPFIYVSNATCNCIFIFSCLPFTRALTSHSVNLHLCSLTVEQYKWLVHLHMHLYIYIYKFNFASVHSCKPGDPNFDCASVTCSPLSFSFFFFALYFLLTLLSWYFFMFYFTQLAAHSRLLMGKRGASWSEKQ